MKIAISKGDNIGNYPLYKIWLEMVDPTIECINLYGLSKNNAIEEIRKCSGLLISGGNDIHPKFYNKNNQESRCFNIDKYRDELELELINNAITLEIPILAICRGQQILNVAMGGTLILDIEEDFDKCIKHKLEGDQKNLCFHKITIANNSLLRNIYNEDNATVNSYHHQAIEKLANSFKVTAYADDKIIEAIEWNDPQNKSFLLGVQWHPERMKLDDIVSIAIAQAFLNASKAYNQN